MRVWMRWMAGLTIAVAAACSSPPSTTSELEACLNAGDRFDCRAEAEVRLLAPPRTIANAASVDVQAGGTAVGGAVDLDFSVVNTISLTTASALRIRDIVLTEEGTKPSFTCTASDGTPCNLMTNKWRKVGPTGGSYPDTVTAESFRIRYKKPDEAVHQATVCVQATGDPGLPASGLCFTLQTKLGKPHIVVEPKSIDFGPVLTGKSAEPKEFVVKNTGDAPLSIGKVAMSGDTGFAVQAPGDATHTTPGAFDLSPPHLIDPGKSEVWVTRFTAVDTNKRAANIELLTNDPAQPKTLVGLAANANVPCLQIIPSPEVSFGAVVVGESSKRPVSLKNCGTTVLDVTAVVLEEGANPGYALDFGTDATPSAEKPLQIPMNQAYALQAVFTPQQLSAEQNGTLVSDIATLAVTSNADPKQTKLTGVGVTAACPKPIIKVQEGEEVVPQTVLHLSGSDSLSPGGGSIAKYKWVVKKQPLGSNQKFVPNSTSVDTTFTTNAAGEYLFCLSVVDANGVSSCNDACTAVIVTPSDCLHAELLWHTPGDADETDTGPGAGSDLDVHLAHELANQPDIDCDGDPDPWFDTSFDCFWWKPKQQWGVAATDKQSPKLDLDDTDGAGPENMSLPEPEGTSGSPNQYALGVHYWNDRGLGHSWAIVRVYVCGQLAAEYNQPHPSEPAGLGVEMKTLDMWYVGKINWPNQLVGGTGPAVTTCYQTGNACKAKKDPSDPAAGLMWQSTGDWCITPCYISGNAPTGGGFCGK